MWIAEVARERQEQIRRDFEASSCRLRGDSDGHGTVGTRGGRTSAPSRVSVRLRHVVVAAAHFFVSIIGGYQAEWKKD
jgi:hypothetical protein